MNYPAEHLPPLQLPDRKVKIGRIRYINVAPIYFGLDNGLRPPWMKLVCEPPSTLNRMLAEGLLDASPVSTAAYAANHKDWSILPDNSISCFGNAVSVILASNRPFDRLQGKKVLLTDESASAAALLKLLFAMQGVKPDFVKATLRNPRAVKKEADAALVIGNAAISEPWADSFEYVLDLGAMWKEATGLPFVFAVVAVRKNFAENYPEAVAAIAKLFKISRQDGENNMETIARRSASVLNLSPAFCESYHNTLQYDLTPQKFFGLKTFFEYLHKYGMISERAVISFFRP